MADEEVEEPVPKRKVLIQAVSGYIGSNLAKRFAADGFEVLGTLKSPADPKPLAVSSVVEPTATALAAAFRSCELIVLDCLGVESKQRSYSLRISLGASHFTL